MHPKMAVASDASPCVLLIAALRRLQFFMAPSLATEGVARSTISGFSKTKYAKVL